MSPGHRYSVRAIILASLAVGILLGVPASSATATTAPTPDCGDGPDGGAAYDADLGLQLLMTPTSDSIQASGTDAIQFDESQNVTVASGDLTLNPSSDSSATLDVQDSGSNSVLTVDTSNDEVIVTPITNSVTLTLKHNDTDGVISTSTGELRLSGSIDVRILPSGGDFLITGFMVFENGMLASPEAGEEDGFIQISIGGIGYQIPIYYS